MRWDWYQATVNKADPVDIVNALVTDLDLSEAKPGRAKNGYLRGVDIKRGDHVLATVWWDGNPGVHVKGTGEDASAVASVLSQGRHRDGWEVLPSRVDACIDWDKPGLFDELSSKLIAFAVEHDIKIDQQGDWERGKARTLYLGARSSTVQLVLYEKGYQVGGEASRSWVRLEIRVYPAKGSREKVARWAPWEACKAAPWLVGALGAIGLADLKADAVGTVWRPSDAARARAAMLRQYRNVLESWAGESGGWDRAGVAIGHELQRMQKADSKA